ncbi:MAG: hypothetical protein COA43_14875 [Robiginitomaculum sp.]|nr:MAG: hypothetical protein COA43_14875 [Robiginitomaculum sp.]
MIKEGEVRRLILSVLVGVALSACGGEKETQSSTSQPVKTQEKTIVKTSAAQSKAQMPQETKPVVVATKPKRTPEQNGKRFYKKCIACHMANGQGVQGSFPSLNAGLDILAATDEGRTYVVLVVYNGLRGNLKTERGDFRGVMVRQAGGKKPQDVADLLNYVLKDFYTDLQFTPFSAEEVKAITDKNGRLSGDKVLALRPKAG